MPLQCAAFLADAARLAQQVISWRDPKQVLLQLSLGKGAGPSLSSCVCHNLNSLWWSLGHQEMHILFSGDTFIVVKFDRREMQMDVLVLVVSLPMQSLNTEQPEEHLWKLLPSWGYSCWHSSFPASLAGGAAPLALCAEFGNGTCEVPSSLSRSFPEWKWDVCASLAGCVGKCAAVFQAVLINLHWWRAWGFWNSSSSAGLFLSVACKIYI